MSKKQKNVSIWNPEMGKEEAQNEKEETGCRVEELACDSSCSEQPREEGFE